MTTALKYTIFALLATGANLGSQHLSVLIYQGMFYIAISIFIGTGVGLVVKYLLDKHYIFQYQTKNMAHDAQKFTLYTLMGVVTTVIFWGTEYAFHYAFGTDLMRYVGGAIGLAIGYVVKYRLDKAYVFK